MLLNKVKGVKESKDEADRRKNINQEVQDAKKVAEPIKKFQSSLKELMSLAVFSGQKV